jgi:DHA1 family bicyclomycin/chloramphenicol resistance-like MFS transporter
MFFGFIFFVGLGNGVTLPSASAGVVNVRPNLAGSASGLAGSLQLGGGAALSVIAGYTISADNGALPLSVVMLISVLCASLGTLYVMRVERQLKSEPQTNND